MNFIKDIYVDISGNLFLLLGLLLAVTVFVYFVYKYTMPDFSKSRKILLNSIKTFSTLLIILLLFGFIIKITMAKDENPTTAFVFDNTASVSELDKDIKLKIDSLFESDVFRKFLTDLKPEYYAFSDKLKSTKLDSLSFKEEGTNLYIMISQLKREIREKNIKTVFLFTDGIYTDGLNPENVSSGIDVPVYCIGTGDTSGHKDVSITRVNYKKINYLGDEVKFNVSVKNTGFTQGISSMIYAKLGDKSVSKPLTLPESDSEKEVEIKIEPEKLGKVSVVFELTPIKDEFSTANNRYEVIINILKKKKDVLIISGFPSFDLKFLKRALKTSDRFKIDQIIYKKNGSNESTFQNKIKDINKRDLVIFLSFPLKKIETGILNLVLNKFNKNRVSVLFVTGADLRLMNTNFINALLGVNISNIYGPPVEVFFKDYGLSGMGMLTFNDGIFKQMPPVHLNDCKLTFDDYRVLLKTDPSRSKKLHYNPENPVMILRINRKQKIIFLNGFNFWKWKFLTITDPEYSHFYDNYFLNICQYLSTAEEVKRAALKTDKDEYTRGEDINVTGEVYDEFFDPQENATYSVYVDNNIESETVLIPIGETGKFQGVLNISQLGKHELVGEAFFNDKSVGKDKKIIYIKRLNVEYLNLDMNEKLLRKISDISGGRYFHISNLEKNLDKINMKSYKKIIENTLSLRNSITILFFIIFLLSLEWFLRKRWGLL